ncbi:MAG: hypothetical protein WCF85_17795 [Rhodospirillaceae bacterium]
MMRVILAVACVLGISMGFGSAAKADTWTCYALVNGKPTGGSVKVEASNKDEARQKAEAEYKKLGYNNVNGVDCR